MNKYYDEASEVYRPCNIPSGPCDTKIGLGHANCCLKCPGRAKHLKMDCEGISSTSTSTTTTSSTTTTTSPSTTRTNRTRKTKKRNRCDKKRNKNKRWRKKCREGKVKKRKHEGKRNRKTHQTPLESETTNDVKVKGVHMIFKVDTPPTASRNQIPTTSRVPQDELTFTAPQRQGQVQSAPKNPVTTQHNGPLMFTAVGIFALCLLVVIVVIIAIWLYYSRTSKSKKNSKAVHQPTQQVKHQKLEYKEVTVLNISHGNGQPIGSNPADYANLQMPGTHDAKETAGQQPLLDAGFPSVKAPNETFEKEAFLLKGSDGSKQGFHSDNFA